MSTHTPIGVDEIRSRTAATAGPDGTTLEDRQKAFLLRQLLEAPGHTLAVGEANKKLGAAARRELDLRPETAKALREELARAGCISSSRQGRTVKLTLTDEGREYLQRLPEDLFAPVKPRTARPPRTESEVSDELRDYQQAYVLLLLLKGKDRKLRSAEFTDRLQTQEANRLDFQGMVSRLVIVPLIEEGLVKEDRTRQVPGDGLYPQSFASYTLTRKGEQSLLTRRQYPGITFKIPTDCWNILVDAYNKHTAPRPVDRPEPVPAPPTHGPDEIASARLAAAILTHFEELLHTKYAHAGMVPIHELRAWVAGQYGPNAASHQTFDALVHDLRRQNKVRFVTITDLRDGTSEQMENSIPGINETFFYLESAHEQSFDF